MRSITIVLTIFKFLTGVITFYSAMILKARGFGGIEIGILLFIYSFIPLIISFPCGILNDRLKSKTLLFIGFIGLSIHLFGFSQISEFSRLFILFLIGGASCNLVNVSLQSLALKIVGRDGRGKKLGLYTAGSSVGFGLGMLFGGLMMNYVRTEYLLIINGTGYLFLAVFSLFLQNNATVKLDIMKYFYEFKNRDVLMFCLVFSLFAFHWGSEMSSYSLFLKEYFKLTLLQIGFYMCFPLILLGISAYYTGRLIDKNIDVLIKLTYIACIVSGMGQVLTLIPNIYISFCMRLFHEVGDGIAALLLLEGMATRFNVKNIGGLSSLIAVSTILASSIGSLIFSYIGATFGYHISMLLGGISMLAPITVFYYYLNHSNKREESPTF